MKEKLDPFFLKAQDRWERARRNPEYLSLSTKAKFGKDGFFDHSETVKEAEDILAYYHCADRFGLQQMLDPSKKFVELLGFTGSDDEEWQKFVETRGRNRIELDIRYLFLGTDTVLLAADEGPAISPDGRYVSLDIDITMPFDEIVDDLKTTVKRLQEQFNIKPRKFGETFMKRFESYAVWDMSLEGKSLKEIALNLRKNYDQVKQQLYMAYERITGCPYDPEELKKIKIEDLQKKAPASWPCHSCENQKCRSGMEVGLHYDLTEAKHCARFLAYYSLMRVYVDQDYAARTEKLGENTSATEKLKKRNVNLPSE